MKRNDFLKRLIGIAGFGTYNLQTIIPKRKIYLEQFFVAGFRHYKGMKILENLQVNDLLELRREPENEHDDCAIALYWQQEKIGFLPSNLNALLSRLIDAKALPLIGTITHLNKKVKPWESVAVAIYFMQDDAFEIPAHAAHLQQIQQPVYQSKLSKAKRDLYKEIFDNYTGIVDINTIAIPEIKSYIEKYCKHEKYTVLYNNKSYVNITTDSIYSYMYNIEPVAPIISDNGKEYILFKFLEKPNQSI